MKISICIPTYKRNDELFYILDNIIRQNKFSQLVKEIIVGDNNPDNLLAENLTNIIKKKKNKILYFRNKENLGFEVNLEKILKKATGDIILILTDDDSLAKSALIKIDNFFNSYPEASFLVFSRNILKNKNKIREEHLFKKSMIILKNDYRNQAKLFVNSFILSGLCFRKSALSLEAYSKFIWTKIPQMAMATNIFLKNNSYYCNQPIINHAILNQVFWEHTEDYMISSRIEILKFFSTKNSKFYYFSKKELLKSVPYLIYINKYKPKKLFTLLKSLKEKRVFKTTEDFFCIPQGIAEIIKKKIFPT